MTAIPRYDEQVEVPWPVGTVRARVLEVYGPPSRLHVLVEVDLGLSDGTKPTYSYPIEQLVRFPDSGPGQVRPR